MDTFVTLFLLLILIIFSAFFSASETSLTSASKPKLTMLADKKNKRAMLALRMLDKYDSLLSTILIGNNIVNIAATSIATMFFIHLLKDDELGSTVSTVVLTIVILIFGEITPKSLAKEYPEKFAMLLSPLLLFFSWVFYPLSCFFSLLKKLLSKMLNSESDRRVTDEELITIVEEACEEGGIDDMEGELIRSAIEFNDLSVSDIITPRVDVVAVPVTVSLEELKNVFRDSMFSRLPVYEDSIDNVVGIVLEKDCCYLCDEAFDIRNYMKDPVCFSEASKIGVVLRTLQKEKAQMGIVIDEYGGTLGIVTTEDIVEELVGEIWDENDDVEEDIIPVDENTYKVLGSTATSRVFRKFDLPDDEESESATMSGWAIEKLGTIPEEGDSFIYENIRVEVLEKDPKKIVSLLITLQKEDENE